MTKRPVAVVALCAAVLVLSARQWAAPRVDAAFDAFWRASGPEAAASAAVAVAQSGVSVDETLDRLRRGRAYAAAVPRGVVKLVRRTPAGEFPYTLDVPASYDPSKRYQVRLQLHGGVGRPSPAMRGDGSVGSLAGREQIYLLPQSWHAAQWWAPSQFENLRAILDTVKRTYNVDENRVVLAGVSDGGTAAYYFAMRDTTPYAAFLPLIGSIMVLRSSGLDLEGALFPNNMRNKPLFVVNAGRDRLYPTAHVEPVLDQLRAGGLSIDYHPQPEGGHNTQWWPTVKEVFETFVAAHPRDPHPSTLTWQTDQTATRNRAHWLVIERLAPPAIADELPDLNNVREGSGPQFGLRTTGMRVMSVVPDSNAASVGFRPGDLITSVNRRVLPGGLDLSALMSVYQAGAPLTFVVERGGASIELKGSYRPTIMAQVSPLFPPDRPSGRVDVVRDGNTVHASTRGVAAFRLLLSPDVFDFSRPITVIADGARVYEGRVQARVETLMKWAARDNDRTMLYGAELAITKPE